MLVPVRVTEMPTQWLIFCKLPMFVFIMQGSHARRKGSGLSLGANTYRSALNGIAMTKNWEELSREAGCVALVL